MFWSSYVKQPAERILHEIQQIASEISSMFASARSRVELDVSVNAVLKILGEFFEADRSYIFLFSDDNLTMSNTHEWCSESTEPQIERLQDLPLDTLPWWNENIKTHGRVHIPNIDALPVEAENERVEFRSQNIRSLIGVPMHGAKGKVIGFCGFDRVHSTRQWSEEQISMIMLLVGLIGNALDRLQAVVALLESETRHSIAFEKSRDAIATLAPPHWKFTSGNPATIMLFGARDAVELTSLTPAGLSPEFQPDGQTSAEKAQQMINIALREGSHYFDWVHQRIDGTDFPATVLLSRMEAYGQPYLHSVIRDDTERKRAEARERALQEQVERTHRIESLGQLTGGIAHDFNNLLTVILGNAELIQMLVDPVSPVTPLATDIVTAAQQGAELTQALLAFARRQTLEPAVVDLNRLVTEMRGLLQRTLGDHIEIRLDLGVGLSAALVDRAQLESALLNLCLNSRDAMPQGGRLTIETRGREPDLNAAESFVTLSVVDTGCGIPIENMERLFEPFFTTKPKGKGTGLGLPMVYGFVQQTGGEVEVFSTPGEGTTARLHLPVASTSAVNSGCGEDSGEVVGGNETILLVEDDALVRNYTYELLTSLGYTVRIASSGPEAIAIAQNDPKIGLLFTDVIMPGGLNGRELAEAIRGFLPDLPVLYTSGYSDGIIEDHADVDLLAKPYRRAELARRIRGRLDSRLGV